MQPVKSEQRILVIGYGNPGRQDDGLGPECVRCIGEWQLSHVATQDCYQLTVEDAYDIAQYELVIFADASLEAIEAFRFGPMTSEDEVLFGSHSLSPAAVVELSHTLFNATTEAYILGIKGIEFDRFEERLSPLAEQNLHSALDFIKPWLEERACA